MEANDSVELIHNNSSNRASSGRVCIGLCTYQRVHLQDTLESLFQLQMPSHIAGLDIVVVDNDKSAFGFEILSKMSFPAGVRVRYCRESKKNISVARNKILELASCDWLALIDDDEIADPDWLIKLDEAREKQPSATAVFGPIESELPLIAPEWLREGKFFDRAPKVDGQSVQTGSTGNAYMNMNIIRAKNFWFDEAYGLTGGEDSQFFFSMHLAGCSMYWAEFAIVRERVEPDRWSAEYLRKRRFRVGQTYSRFRFDHRSSFAKFLFASKISVKLVLLYTLYAISIMSRPFGAFFSRLADQSSTAENPLQQEIAEIASDLKRCEAKGMLDGIVRQKWLQMY